MRSAGRLAGILATAVLLGAGGIAGTGSTSRPPEAGADATRASTALELEWKRVLTNLGLERPEKQAWHTLYRTGFEHDADLAGFYATPQSPMTRHRVATTDKRHRGERAHHAWLTGVTGSEPVDGPNHRGYPTIQLPRRPEGPCPSPCLIQFWARIARWSIHPGEWLSLATFTPDGSDQWSRVVTVNVASDNRLFLYHVPTHGIGETVFQRSDPFPDNQWVRITTLLDLRGTDGAAAVWQDGRLMSAAEVDGGDGDLDQMHFGLYAAPPMSRGTVWNDDITVRAPSSGM